MSFPALPDSLASINSEIRTIENQLAMHWSDHAVARLDALEEKRDQMRAEQIQRGYVHEGFEKPRAV